MQTVKMEVGVSPKVRILSIGGDLRLSGRETEQLEVKAPQGEEILAEQVGEWIEIQCRSDCLIYLPRDAQIEGESIGGDARATDLSGDLLLRTIGGDLSLRSVGTCSFKHVGGDLLARSVGGHLSIDMIGGDAIVDRISGDVRLIAVGGDLSLRRVDGSVQCSVGGDSSLIFTTLGGREVKVNTGGALSCRLPRDASARIALKAAGNRSVKLPSSAEQSEDGDSITLGEGEVDLQLTAGGDLWLRVGEMGGEFTFPDLGDEIAAQVEQEIELGVAEMEARLGALGAGIPAFDSRQIGERVRRAVNKARRQSERARARSRAKADHVRDMADRYRSRGPDLNINLGAQRRKSPSPVSEEERLAILRMLENGAITVDEAEKLLQALENS